jgi:hypothetical protein
MKMNRKIAALLLSAALLLASCGSGVKTSKLFGFSAECPEGWEFSEDSISACFGVAAEDDFYENVSYSGADPWDGTLADYADLLAEALAQNSANFTEISREEAAIAGMDALVLTYTCTSSQTTYIIKQRMFLMHDGAEVHNLVYTAHEGSFDAHAAEALAIAESFQAK